MYRGEATVIGIWPFHFGISNAGGVSNWWHRSSGPSSRTDLCQGESGSGASLGAIIVMSDRTLAGSPSNEFDGAGVFSDGTTFRGELLCAEQE
jgi:hypothetical protein